MAKITEFAWFPMKPGMEDSEPAKALEALRPQLRTQPGLEGAWYGSPVERPGSSEFAHVWESEEAWKAAQGSDLSAEARKYVVQLIDTSDPAVKPYRNAVLFDKPFDKVVAAPVVQISSLFLPTDVDTAAFKAAIDRVVDHMYSSPPDGFVVGAHGWALNEVNDSKVFVAVSGWESIEKRLAAHAGVADKFAEVQKFTTAIEVHHTSFKKSGE